jgi:acyl-coenzyme A synthetase/AMP-(fatty) acid ligase
MLSEITIPETFNAAAYFVDRNVAEGRGAKIAIECGDERVTYQQLLERVNRVGNALRDQLQVRIEERILLLLPDEPELIYSFFGAMKIGAIPVPVNTLWKPLDYEYVLNDSRARVAIVRDALLPQIQAIPRDRLRYLRHIVVVGSAIAAGDAVCSFIEVVARGSPVLEAEPTCRDDAAFWL